MSDEAAHEAERAHERSLANHNMATATASTPDIAVTGDPGAWVVVGKASSKSQGWMKSTKRMRVPGGWLYQATTEHRHEGRVVACAEALAFVPDDGTHDAPPGEG